MKRLARPMYAWGLLVLALFASGAPLPSRAQEEPRAEPSAVAPAERTNQTERAANRRTVIRRTGSLPGSENLTRAEQRALRRHLLRLSPRDRERFLRDWDRKSPLEQRRFVREQRERRSARELPARLRTPEMRERLEGMTNEERQRFFRQARKWRDMNATERRQARARLERFGALDEAAQRELIDEKFGSKSPEAREKILRDLQDAARRVRERDAAAATAAPPDAKPAPASE